MDKVLIVLGAVGFFISIFPIHVYNYIYFNSEEKFASLNVTIFRFIRIFNANTIKNNPREISINGKNKKLDKGILNVNFYKIFNQLCIHKIIQLSDIGMQNNDNAYVALAHNSVTTSLYKFLEINDNQVKLRNYTIFNEEHPHIRYYAKAVTVINLIVIMKIIFLIIMEKIK